jgi:hypothetical protein
MPILVTVSVNLADSVTLRDLRQFVDAAERNGADPEVDLREYDDNNDLVGLAAVGELESGEGDDVDGDEGEDEGESDEGDDEGEGEGEGEDEGEGEGEGPVAGGESLRQS